MFNNLKPNVILLTDYTENMSLTKGLGVYKAAAALRNANIETLVINHLSAFSVNELVELLSKLVSNSTLFVGVNNTFYPNLEEIQFSETGGMSTLQELPAAGAILPHGKQYNQLIIETIKSKNSNTKIVLGGPSAIDLAWNKDFDYIILGYADISIVKLAEHLLNPQNQLTKSRKSIWGFIIVDDAKAEDFDFVNSCFKYEDHDIILPGETLSLEVSRGCIFKCAFCAFPLNGKKKLDFIKSFESLRTELIDNWQRFGVTRYMIVDDTLNDSVEKCQFLCDLSESLPFKLEYWAFVRLDLLAAHPETIDLLFRSGLRAAYYGIETLNYESAKLIGKGGSREKLIKTIEYVKNTYKGQINQTGSFIFGLPKESIESLEQTAKWLTDDNCPLDSFSAYPVDIKRKVSHAEFTSKFDEKFEEYGYVDTGIRPNYPTKIFWKNEYTTYDDMVVFVQNLLKRRRTVRSIPGRGAFELSGLGEPLENLLSHNINDINWDKIDRLKFNRVKEYKNKLYSMAGIAMPDLNLGKDPTFTQLLKHYHKKL